VKTPNVLARGIGPLVRPVQFRVSALRDRIEEIPSVIDIEELESAFEFVSSVAPFEHSAFLCRETGAVFLHSDIADMDEELPDDIDSDRYLEIPHQNDLGLGRQLAVGFTEEFLPEEYDKVRQIFSRRGAYARFKDLLERKGMLQQWYEHERRARIEALRQWCRANDIAVDG